MKDCCKIDCELVKKYEPKPKNTDGSIKWFLYRWDDGKSGCRKLVRCKECGNFYLIQCYKLNKFSDNADSKECGNFYLIQCYKLNKFSDNADTLFEDWYAVDSEEQADLLNKNYTGVQLEHNMKEIYRICKGE